MRRCKVIFRHRHSVATRANFTYIRLVRPGYSLLHRTIYIRLDVEEAGGSDLKITQLNTNGRILGRYKAHLETLTFLKMR